MNPDRWAALAVLTSCVFALAAYRHGSAKVNRDVKCALAEAKLREEIRAAMTPPYVRTTVTWPSYLPDERAHAAICEELCRIAGMDAQAEWWSLAARAAS